MSDSIRITIRLSREALEKLEELVEKGEYKNISEVVRTAIEEFLKEKNPPDNIKKLRVDLPRSTVNELMRLVEEGDAVDLDDAIRTAVREYVKRRLQEITREQMRQQLDNLKKESNEMEEV